MSKKNKPSAGDEVAMGDELADAIEKAGDSLPDPLPPVDVMTVTVKNVDLTRPGAMIEVLPGVPQFADAVEKAIELVKALRVKCQSGGEARHADLCQLESDIMALKP